jgi:hypothetical protein
MTAKIVVFSPKCQTPNIFLYVWSSKITFLPERAARDTYFDYLLQMPWMLGLTLEKKRCVY